MYRIKVSYQTGSSFGSEDTHDYLELSWNNLEVAKENLQAIKEHYEVYRNFESWRRKTKTLEELFEEHGDKFWFVRDYNNWDYKNKVVKKKSGKLDQYSITHCMRLKTDDGNLMQQSNFWCGYFETLYGAEIVSEQDNDMKFEI